MAPGALAVHLGSGISVDANADGAATVSLDVPDTLADGHIPLMVWRQDDSDPWKPVYNTIYDGEVLAAEVDHFTDFAVASVDQEALEAEAASIASADGLIDLLNARVLKRRVPEPECASDPPPPINATYTPSIDDTDPFVFVCVEADPGNPGTAVLHVANNRALSIELLGDQSWQMDRRDRSEVFPWVTEKVNELNFGSLGLDSIVIGGGETAEIALSTGTTPLPSSLDFELSASALYYEFVLKVSSKTFGGVAEIADTAASGANCGVASRDGTAVDRAWGMALDCALGFPAQGALGGVSNAYDGAKLAAALGDTPDLVPVLSTYKIELTAGQFADTELIESVESDGLPSCADPLGDWVTASVTGVAEWVNGRGTPSSSGAATAQLPKGSLVLAFPDDGHFAENRFWYPVVAGSDPKCVWVGGSFLKTGTGELGSGLLDLPTASGFVYRALRGLDAESALATMVPPDLHLDLEPIDAEVRANLEEQVRVLRAIGQVKPELVVVPDTTWTPGVDSNGCYLSDTLACQVFIRDGGINVARVNVGRHGNGWDSIWIESFETSGTFSCSNAKADAQLVRDAILTPERAAQYEQLLEDYYESIGGEENRDNNQPIMYDTDGAVEASIAIVNTLVSDCEKLGNELESYGWEVMGEVNVVGNSWHVISGHYSDALQG